MTKRRIAAICGVVAALGLASSLVAAGDVAAGPSAGSRTKRAASVETVRYKPNLKADVYRPAGAGPFAAVLLVHGGGLSVGSRKDAGMVGLARVLQQRGVIGVSIDYTLNAGFSPAGGDVRDALSWLKRLPDVIPIRVALVGHSSGAGLVAAAGYQDGARAVVLVAPGVSLAGTARTYGTPDDPETLIIHGSLDELVTPDEIRQVVDAVAGAGIAHEYRVVERLGHYEAVRAQVAPIAAWLAFRLRG